MAKDFLEVMDKLMEHPSSSGSLVRAFRKKFKLTQKDLENITGISESNISAIEHDRVELGVKRAEMFAVVFGIHPSTLLYPNDKWTKSKEIIAIEKRAARYLKIG